MEEPTPNLLKKICLTRSHIRRLERILNYGFEDFKSLLQGCLVRIQYKGHNLVLKKIKFKRISHRLRPLKMLRTRSAYTLQMAIVVSIWKSAFSSRNWAILNSTKSAMRRLWRRKLKIGWTETNRRFYYLFNFPNFFQLLSVEFIQKKISEVQPEVFKIRHKNFKKFLSVAKS